MYFWNIEALKRDIVGGRLTEKDRFVYALIYIVFSAATYEYFQGTNTEYSNLWDKIEAIANVVVVLAGTYFTYRANGANNGRDFLGRYFSLGFVVTIRFLVFLFPIVILRLMYESPFGVENEATVTTPFGVSLVILWSCFLYVNLAKHMKLVKNT
ncbi:hypothetical protein L3V31_15785 [Vibrio sp. J1-1]|uniref:hypothetical protein n=1 Tax=Vibrio sp. J1-1 TaxID=2912251 RepID=UPI001F48604B|nr:hypothetical protein [Vibrio sp. J1-1]MBR9875587.1 hypothetical protein [Vibrionaceae bacterium]MCF7483169.1 hypothetical protein [Vibrio sp. J1-1]